MNPSVRQTKHTMNWILCFFGLAAVPHVICGPIDIPPCSKENSECLTQLSREIFKIIINGDEENGLPHMDPLDIKLIEGKLDTLSYTLTNSVLTGYKNCEIESARLTPDHKNAIFKMYCPDLKMKGDYVLDGTLIGLPVKGNGDYVIQTHDYYMTITCELKRTQGSDGLEYLSFKNFKLDADLKTGFDFELGNLFDGNKALADTTKSFIKENWQTVAKIVQGPIMNSNVEKLIKNANKYLKRIPANKYIDL